MKKIFPLIVFIASISALQAQITITDADMPGIDDTFRYTNVNAFTLPDYTLTGASYTWDFSMVDDVSQDLRKFERAIDVNPGYVFFGTSAFGEKVIDSIGAAGFQVKNIYDFYENSPTEFYAEGRGMEFSGFGIPSFYSDNDEIYQFPLDYADYDSSTFAVSFSLATFGGFWQEGFRINEVDGWGTVTTPEGTYNCIRVKTTIDEVDSVYIDMFGFGFNLPRKQIEYKWLTNDDNVPVFEVSGPEVFGTFTPTRARYRDNYKVALQPPTADFTADATSTFVNTTVSLTSTSGPIINTYDWTITPATYNFIGGTDANSTNPMVEFTDPGLYTIELFVTNDNGFDSRERNNYVGVNDFPTSVEPVAEALSLNVFPIPAKGFLNIETNSTKEFDWTLIDLTGQIVKKGSVKNQTRLDVSDLQVGVYFIKLNNGKSILTKRVTVID